MMWDGYFEPTEFDIAMADFKASIVDNVRKEIKDKIDRLEKENAELREVKDNWDQIKREHATAMCELSLAKEQAKRQAEKARLQTVFRDLCVIGYRVHCEYMQGPKCDKCDEYRKIHFVSPMGRSMTEDCQCAASKAFCRPREESLISFYIGDGVQSRYYTRNDDVYADRYDCCAEVYSELPEELATINSYRAVFLNVADCQAYCDWHNKMSGLSAEDTKEEN